MLRGAVYVVLAGGLFLPVVYAVYAQFRSTGVQGPGRQQLLDPQSSYPEPDERAAYLIGLVFLPATLFTLSWVGRRCGWLNLDRWRYGRVARWLGEGVFAVALVALACWSVGGDGRYHLQFHLYHLHPVLSLPMIAAAVAALFWPDRLSGWVRTVGWVVAAATAGFIGYASVFDETHLSAVGEETVWGYHFNAMFGADVAVAHGRVLLDDSLHQYGCAPHLLRPLFAATGLTVFTYSAVMGTLTAVSYLALWSGLVKVVRNPWVAVFGFLAVVMFNWLVPNLGYGLVDHYFQYRPLRLLFPMAAVALAVHTHQQPSRWATAGSLVLLCVGVLWNFDAGVPSLVAWVAGRGYTSLALRPFWQAVAAIARDLMAAGGCAVGVFGLYAVGIHLEYGVWPDFRQLLVFQKVFYLTGYFMLPMPLPHTWVMLVLVYLAGFGFAVRSAVGGVASPRSHAAFVLSVLGMALFSYYQGRSADTSLCNAGWPAVALAAVLLDELTDGPWQRLVRPLHLAAGGLLLWTLSGAAGGVPVHLPVAARTVQENRGRPDPHIGPAVELIRAHVTPGEDLLALSLRDGVLHHLTDTRSVSPCPYSQLARMEEIDTIRQRLDAHPGTKVFSDRRGTHWLPPSDERLALIGLDRFVLLARGDEGDIWERTPPLAGDPTLATPETGRLLVRFRDLSLEAGLSLPPVALSADCTIELVLRPAADQDPEGWVAGNYDYRVSEGGFALVQLRPGSLTLVVGGGNSPQPVLSFPLPAGRWVHVAVTIGPEAASAYVNGRLVASGPRPTGVNWDARRRLTVGNAPTGGRAFRGEYRRLRLYSRQLSPREVEAEARLVEPGTPTSADAGLPTAEEWERRWGHPKYTPSLWWGGGFSSQQAGSIPGCPTYRWASGEGELRLVNESFRPRRARVQFTTLSAAGPGELRVTGPGFDHTLRVSLTPTQYEHEFELSPGPNEIRFVCDAPPRVQPNRTEVFAVHGLTILPPTGEPTLR